MQLDLLPEEAAKASAVAVPILSSETPAPPIAAQKEPGAFKTISEAASILDVPQHVLRFWESRFSQIKPMKLRGGRRYYRPEDMEILSQIKHLLYKQGYTIKGARKAFSNAQPARKPIAQAAPAKKSEQTFTDKQYSQLAVIRQELIGLRETLKAHL